MNDAPSEDDFQSALMSEMGIEAPAADPPASTQESAADEDKTPPAADPQVPDDDKKTDEPAKGQGDDEADEKTDEEKEADLVANETEEETAARHEKEAADKAAEEPEPLKPLTAEDIADLLDKREQAATGHVEQIKQASQEVIEKLYPEGIDTNVYDTDGRVIETAQDIVDRKLINPNTNEAFTYDEAASFMLDAGKRMAESLEKINSYATTIAETNVSLKEGNDRVVRKWGETLKTLPESTVKLLADTYINKQLRFDKTGSYVTEMAMTPDEFYDVALAPYTDLRVATDKSSEESEAKAKAEKEERQRAEQEERNGLPGRRGTASVKANTGNEYLDAFVDELAKP